MGGFFGVVSYDNCTPDLYLGIDYHSHLGTKLGGMAVYNSDTGWDRSIHHLANAPFQTKFESALDNMKGHIGIGCISDTDAQPLVVKSRFGTFAIVTVGRINNEEALASRMLQVNDGYFLENEKDSVNATELAAMLINEKNSIAEGIRYAQEQFDGSMSMLVASPKGTHCGRDLYGRTPMVIAKKENGDYCVSLESSAYQNLGYKTEKVLGPGEVVFVGEKSAQPGLIQLIEKKKPEKEKKVCAFLWAHYGCPTSNYEGINVEETRMKIGQELADADQGQIDDIDSVSGLSDSSVAAAIGYAERSGKPFRRVLMKNTLIWPRGFKPADQKVLGHIAHMQLIPNKDLIEGKKLLIIDDSIACGAKMKETAALLFKNGAKEVHVRTVCPPVLYGCRYIKFSRYTSEADLIARRVILELENGQVPSENRLQQYVQEGTDEHKKMVDQICRQMHVTSLKYPTLDMLVKAIGLKEDELCTYCWTGRD